jgi:hypothetical protein
MTVCTTARSIIDVPLILWLTGSVLCFLYFLWVHVRARLEYRFALPEEGPETFAFLQTIHREAEQFYPSDQIYLVGNSTSDYDLSAAFDRDNIVIIDAGRTVEEVAGDILAAVKSVLGS